MALVDQDIDEKNNPVSNQTNNLLNKVEKNPEVFNKDPNLSAKENETNPTSKFANNLSGGSGNDKFSFKGSFSKKKGLLSGGSIAGIGGIGLISFSGMIPILGLNHFSAILTDDLNDQLPVIKIRGDRMLAKKVKGLSATMGSCTPVKIRCKFGSMSNKMVKNFEKAGIKVKVNGTNALGRPKVTGFTFPDGTEVKNPKELKKSMRNNQSVRSSLRRGFNPKFMGFRDKVSTGVLKRLGTNRSKKINGTTDAERKKSMEKAVKKNGDGKATHYKADDIDDDGKKNNANKKINDLDGNVKSSAASGGLASKIAKVGAGGIKGALKGVMITGHADTACTVYGTIRAVSAASKVIKALQLAQFAMVFLNTADAVRTGKAKPGDVEYLMNKLTFMDSRETIIDEKTGNEIVNKFLHKSGFDAPGFKIPAYNAAPVLTPRSVPYTVGGGVAGTLDGFMNRIKSIVGNPKTSCKAIQSWWTRGAGLVGGLIVGVGSFGFVTAGLMAGSFALGFAAPFIEAMLADIVAGQVAGDWTKGVDAGDAFFAGAAILTGGMAMASGMKPANRASLKKFSAISNKIKEEEIALDKYDAKEEPFNIYNKYSTLGSFAHNLFLTQNRAKSILSNITSLAFSANNLINIGTKTRAAKEFNEDRFSRCNDDAYLEIGIDADVFCNVRYASSDIELNADIMAVVEWMEDNEQIDAETGSPKDEYEKWVEHCTNRDDAGWGEVADADDQGNEWASGAMCMKNGTDDKTYPIVLDREMADPEDNIPTSANMGNLQIFRVFHADYRVSEGMDEGYDEGGGGGSGEGSIHEGDDVPAKWRAISEARTCHGQPWRADNNCSGGAWLGMLPGQCAAFAAWRVAQQWYGRSLNKDGSNLEELLNSNPLPGVGSSLALGNGKDVAGNIIEWGIATPVDGLINSKPGDIVSESGSIWGHVYVIVSNPGTSVAEIEFEDYNAERRSMYRRGKIGNRKAPLKIARVKKGGGEIISGSGKGHHVE